MVSGPGLPPATPFVRLTRVHALMTAGETAMVVALADSLFLSISPDAARTKVLLFLAISMAPFAVIAPVIGPVIDKIRGGQRVVVMLVGVLRSMVLIAMAMSLDSLRLFPLAFAALVLGKTYAIAKSALVPTTVPNEDLLVEANSKLGQVAGITGFIVAVPAVLLQFVDTRATLALGVVAFLGAALNARRLPATVVAEFPAQQIETDELHLPVVLRAANSMRLLRGSVGFMFFHLAFWLRKEVAGTAWFGFALAMSGLATLGANFAAPHIRRRMSVKSMLLGALAAIAVAGVCAAWYNRIVGGILLAAVVNAAAALGRLAFEATVQSGAPDANRGRAFAKFETQNQIAWVIGGLVPVILAPDGRFGFAAIGFIGIVGVAFFLRSGKSITGSRSEQAINRVRRSRLE